MYNKVKTAKEIEAIRQSGKILGMVMHEIEKMLKPGVTGKEIDAFATKAIVRLDGIPSLIGYLDFPYALCISVNDAVVHGLPNDIPFEIGDIVGFDFCVTYEGMVTDATRTFVVGGFDKAPSKVQALLKATQRSLDDAINQVKNGVHIGDISAAAQKPLDAGGYGNVRDLVGHGVGHHVHEEPEVPNYGVAGKGPILKSGMTIAIEPMSTLGDYNVVVDPDGWTIRTRDGSLSAHFEDTILVTDDGCEILTRL